MPLITAKLQTNSVQSYRKVFHLILVSYWNLSWSGLRKLEIRIGANQFTVIHLIISLPFDTHGLGIISRISSKRITVFSCRTMEPCIFLLLNQSTGPTTVAALIPNFPIQEETGRFSHLGCTHIVSIPFKLFLFIFVRFFYLLIFEKLSTQEHSFFLQMAAYLRCFLYIHIQWIVVHTRAGHYLYLQILSSI